MLRAKRNVRTPPRTVPAWLELLSSSCQGGSGPPSLPALAPMTQDSPAPVVCVLHSLYCDFSIRQVPSFCKHTGIFPQNGFLKKAPRVSQRFLQVPSTAGARRPAGRWCWIPCDVRWTVGEAPPGPWERRPSAAGERDQTLVPTLTSDGASKGPPHSRPRRS